MGYKKIPINDSNWKLFTLIDGHYQLMSKPIEDLKELKGKRKGRLIGMCNGSKISVNLSNLTIVGY